MAAAVPASSLLKDGIAISFFSKSIDSIAKLLFIYDFSFQVPGSWFLLVPNDTNQKLVTRN
jgi:hypothetical protein